MGKKARELRERTERRIRSSRLTSAERDRLRDVAKYEGSPAHKRNPQDFGLTPPAAPRSDATLCDEAGSIDRTRADELLRRAIDEGVVSEATTGIDTPKHLWAVVDDQVFEAAYGGSRSGCYHGYPVRKTDPLHAAVLAAWNNR